MSEKYQIEGTVSGKLDGHPISLFTFPPVDLPLSGVPDELASLAVGSGLSGNGTAVFQQTASGQTLQLTATDNIPGLPASLSDDIALPHINAIEGEGIVLAEHVGLELDIAWTITKVAA